MTGITFVLAAVLWLAPAPQKEPRPDVLKKICASQFGQGDFARIEVFYDKAGSVAVLALRPDINRFTHAPHTYYGPDGATLLVVPERPIAAEQAKSDPVLQKLDALMRDLKEGQSKVCSSYR